MNVNNLTFKSLTRYLIAPETLDTDKHNITSRIIEETGITPARESYHFVRYNNWRGGETIDEIVKNYNLVFGKTVLSKELLELALDVIIQCDDRCDEDRVMAGGKWYYVWEVKKMLQEFLYGE